jgi:hypothetical protein
MYQIATNTQREAGLKIKQAVAAVHPEHEDEVAAFQRRKGNKILSERRAQTRQRNLDPKDSPTISEATPAQEIMPTKTANTVSIANYKITPKRNASNKSVKRNRVKTDKAVPTGLECT